MGLMHTNRTKWEQLPLSQRIADVTAELEADMARWRDIKENGCSDPSWPDGVNMNLKRNHIIYDLMMLADLEKKPVQITFQMLIDGNESASIDIQQDSRVPPLVPDDYMAHERRCTYFCNGARKEA